jgi:hypothetical protein
MRGSAKACKASTIQPYGAKRRSIAPAAPIIHRKLQVGMYAISFQLVVAVAEYLGQLECWELCHS